jgi:hypothetical protein
VAWTVFVLLLLGGGAVLAYFLFVQNADRPVATQNGTTGTPVGNGSVNAPSAIASGTIGSDVGSGVAVASGSIGSDVTNPEGSGTTVGSGSGSAEVENGSGSDQGAKPGLSTVGSGSGSAHQPAHGSAAPPPPHHPVVVVATVGEEKDPKALEKKAQDAEKAGDYDTARQLYSKLEKSKAYAAVALYHEAYAAFQLGDTAGAVDLARRAANLPGPLQSKAKLLYADGLFKQGDFKRARDLYLALRHSLSGDDKAQATHKIAWCNQHLGFPDQDGITGP